MVKKRKIKAILSKGKDPSQMDSFRSWIGKKVISKSGDIIGKVQDFRFSKSTIAGIVVMKNISRLFIGNEFISAVSADAVMLSIDPVTMLVGKKVFDANGKEMGKVARLVRKGSSNSFEAVIIKKKIYSKGMKVPKADVEVSKKSIILKKSYE